MNTNDTDAIFLVKHENTRLGQTFAVTVFATTKAEAYQEYQQEEEALELLKRGYGIVPLADYDLMLVPIEFASQSMEAWEEVRASDKGCLTIESDDNEACSLWQFGSRRRGIVDNNSLNRLYDNEESFEIKEFLLLCFHLMVNKGKFVAATEENVLTKEGDSLFVSAKYPNRTVPIPLGIDRHSYRYSREEMKDRLDTYQGKVDKADLIGKIAVYGGYLGTIIAVEETLQYSRCEILLVSGISLKVKKAQLLFID